ncbi:MAG: hypothetical protein PVG81_12225 [Desulfobacterales bacterium]|jgi:hypothetical protein
MKGSGGSIPGAMPAGGTVSDHLPQRCDGHPPPAATLGAAIEVIADGV